MKHWYDQFWWLGPWRFIEGSEPAYDHWIRQWGARISGGTGSKIVWVNKTPEQGRVSLWWANDEVRAVREGYTVG